MSEKPPGGKTHPTSGTPVFKDRNTGPTVRFRRRAEGDEETVAVETGEANMAEGATDRLVDVMPGAEPTPVKKVSRAEPIPPPVASRRVFDPRDDMAKDAGREGAIQDSDAEDESMADSEPVMDTDDFAAMFAASDKVDSAAEELSPGDMVTGHIVQIGSDFAFVDLGGKIEAYIGIEELRDGDGEMTIGVGESLTARVLRVERGGQIRLALKAGGRGKQAVEDAFEAGVPVEGRVTGTNKGGFEVEVMGTSAFCPFSQIALGFTQDPEVHVGQAYSFQITEYSEGGRRFACSVASRAGTRANRGVARGCGER